MDLKEIHGEEPCHICGKQRYEDGGIYCSYPHGMVPVERVGDTPIWTWEKPKE